MENKKLKEFISTLQTMAMQLDEETVAEQTQAVESPEDNTAQAASATPYADNGYNPADDLHCYKSFNLPDDICVQVDILKKSRITLFDHFSGIAPFMGLKLMHVYKNDNKNSPYGNGFNFTIAEKFDGTIYIDGLGDQYKVHDGFVAGMKYFEEAPDFVKGYQDIKLWLYNGTCAKGFNSNGYLVVICDVYNNYQQIIYDANNKISIIKQEKIQKDSEEKIYVDVYQFIYSSGYLTRIAEERNGKKVLFTYNNGQLVRMASSDGRILTLSYDSNLMTITSSDGYIHNINSYIKIITQSSVSKIPDGSKSTNLPPILYWNILFRGNKVRIEDINDNYEYYTFTDDGMASEFYKEENSVITYAEKREYVYDTSESTPKQKLTVNIAPDTILNKFSYSSFTYTVSPNDEQIYSVYDLYNRVDEEIHKNIRISPSTYKSYLRKCNYNNYNIITGESTEICIYNLSDGQEYNQQYFTYKVEYGYNDGKLSKRSLEGYFSKGTEVEEYEYNAAGQVTKIISYNSLEPDKVFINEKTYDQFGRLVTETDGSGLGTLKYIYQGSVTKPYGIILPNGCAEYHYFDNRYRTNEVILCEGGNQVSNINSITYANNEAVKYSDGSNTINFGYDNQRQLNNVNTQKVDSNEIYKLYDITYNLQDVAGNLLATQSLTVTNAKDETFTCEEDKNHTYTTIKYGEDIELTTSYLNHKYINTEYDRVSGEIAKYTYNNINKITGYYNLTEKREIIYNVNFDYDLDGKLSRITQSGTTDISYEYWYKPGPGPDGELDRITVSQLINNIIVNDNLNRYAGRKVTYGRFQVLFDKIEYKQNASISLTTIAGGTRTVNRQSNLPSKITYADGKSLSYSYDESGNISKVVNSDGKRVLYTYDKANRLIREDNEEFKYSYYYKYDDKGNILSKEKIPFTTDYYHHEIAAIDRYTYQDGRITSAGDGLLIGYDEIGNPILYRGMRLQWKKGKQLISYGGLTFEYDGRGRRIKKGETSYYYDFNDRLIASSDGMQYFYDNIGVAGFKYDEEFYFYQRDIQNNVIAILDKSGNAVVKYVYDAWGNYTLSGSNTVLGKLNPFRYRSYFYDTETKLYYLKSRYYDPEIGRFINMDGVQYADPETINGLNLYAYCNNNPVNYIDYTGNFAIAITIGLISLFALASTAYIESKYHPIQNAVEDISDAIWDLANDLYGDIKENIDNNNSYDLILNLPTSDSIDYLYQINNVLYTKNYNPDPFARPGQKKQGGELKNKSRKKPGWQDRSGHRRVKQPKKHTPGRDHRKYMEFLDLLTILFF